MKSQGLQVQLVTNERRKEAESSQVEPTSHREERMDEVMDYKTLEPTGWERRVRGTKKTREISRRARRGEGENGASEQDQDQEPSDIKDAGSGSIPKHCSSSIDRR